MSGFGRRIVYLNDGQVEIDITSGGKRDARFIGQTNSDASGWGSIRARRRAGDGWHHTQTPLSAIHGTGPGCRSAHNSLILRMLPHRPFFGQAIHGYPFPRKLRGSSARVATFLRFADSPPRRHDEPKHTTDHQERNPLYEKALGAMRKSKKRAYSNRTMSLNDGEPGVQGNLLSKFCKRTE